MKQPREEWNPTLVLLAVFIGASIIIVALPWLVNEILATSIFLITGAN